MIIIYHLDEKNGIPFAQLLFEKGYNNIFLVSGGIYNKFIVRKLFERNINFNIFFFNKFEGIEDFIKEHRDYCEGKDIPMMKKSCN